MKKFFYSHIIITCLFLIPFTGCSSFPYINSGSIGVRTDDVQVRIAFNESDRRIIHDYYSRKKPKHKNLPPGLAKKGELPPGLQNQLQKNGKLPPGLARRQLPYELERRLSSLPHGYVRVEVEGSIVLMNESTEVILDVIHDLG